MSNNPESSCNASRLDSRPDLSGADDATLISPLAHSLCGTISVPGDKSISHRAVLFSAMAEGVSHLSGVLDSADVRSSLAAVEALGAQVDMAQGNGAFDGTIKGWGDAGPVAPTDPIDCGNSGTTVRLLMGILAPWNEAVTLTGDDSLRRRPMARITKPLSLMGARFCAAGGLNEPATLPLIEEGTRDLHAITYDCPVASAQLKTAVLLAGLSCFGTTTVCEPAPSRNHTELMLPPFGVCVSVEDNTVSVTGPVHLCATTLAVPGDPSSAAFIVCAALLKEGSDVTVCDVSLNPSRIGFVEVLKRMGAQVDMQDDSHDGEPQGNIHAQYTPYLHGCEIQSAEIPSLIDEIPVLSLIAAFSEGTTIFHGAGELRVKESDRLAAIIEGLDQLGVHAFACGDDLHIEGNPDLDVPQGCVFDSLGDHRLAMTWALAGLCSNNPVKVRGFESVCVSYPGFLSDMQRLGD